MTPHIPHLHVGSGLHDGALTLFPVWTDTEGAHGLDWRPNALGVHELPDGAEVNRLQIHNRSTRPAVLLEGDLLEGGMQNRMTAADRLLAAGVREAIDVYCVEHGRWSGTRDHRGLGGRGSLAVRYHGHVNRGSNGQSAVWQRIHGYDRDLRHTRTSSMLEHLADRRTPSFRPLSGQRGVIIGVGGQIVGAEIFGSSTGLKARWSGILRAAQLDAELAPAYRTSASLARAFARTLGQTELVPAGEAGRAVSLAGEHAYLRATAMSTDWDAELVHLTAFDERHPVLALA
jgi:hypothetical protein